MMSSKPRTVYVPCLLENLKEHLSKGLEREEGGDRPMPIDAYRWSGIRDAMRELALQTKRPLTQIAFLEIDTKGLAIVNTASYTVLKIKTDVPPPKIRRAYMVAT
jgi:hypothetical protein